jgi:hypothetical protein
MTDELMLDLCSFRAFLVRVLPVEHSVVRLLDAIIDRHT